MARVVPIPKLSQKSTRLRKKVSIAPMPGRHNERKPASCSSGLAIATPSIPRKVPKTPQNGMTKPAKMGPKCAVNPSGVAGMKFPVTWVKSTQGMGTSSMGSVRRAPEMAGIAT